MDYKEKVIALLNSQELSKEQKEKLESIFPELQEKESADEKIRKELYIYLDWLDGRKDYAPKGIYNIKDMLAWVEKQGEKDPCITHPHWISVEDELPPKKSEYDNLSNNVLATDGKEIYESVYNYDFEDWFTLDFWGLDNITHWMPLPKAPKGRR